MNEYYSWIDAAHSTPGRSLGIIVILGIIVFVVWIFTSQTEAAKARKKEKIQRNYERGELQRKQTREREIQKARRNLNAYSPEVFSRELRQALAGSRVNRAVRLANSLPDPANWQVREVINAVSGLKMAGRPAIESDVPENLVEGLIGFASIVEIDLCETAKRIIGIMQTSGTPDYRELPDRARFAFDWHSNNLYGMSNDVNRAREFLTNITSDESLRGQSAEPRLTWLKTYISLNDPEQGSYLRS